MVFINLCALVLWMKVASALEGFRFFFSYKCSPNLALLIAFLKCLGCLEYYLIIGLKKMSIMESKKKVVNGKSSTNLLIAHL